MPAPPAPASPAAAAPNWRAACRAQGIDPAEVDMVAGRYLAYRRFMAGQAGALSLDDWFRFYRLEKQSELGSDGVVNGCSATGEAVGQACLARPQDFSVLLAQAVAAAPTAGVT